MSDEPAYLSCASPRMMKILVFGNSGSGKSTYARALADCEGLAHLDLDSVVWEPNQIAVPRSSAATHQSLEQFLAGHDRWVIEGCYGELVEAAAPRLLSPYRSVVVSGASSNLRHACGSENRAHDSARSKLEAG